MYHLAFIGSEHPSDKTKAKAEHSDSMDELEKAITAGIEAAQKNDGWNKMED
jgi:hypothetical protein